MGYMRHHAVLVTSADEKLLAAAHGHARGLGCSTTPIVPGIVNGYATFVVVPDGSKEGWDESETGDRQRAQLKAWLDAQAFNDGSNLLGWVEVQYQDDEQVERITASSLDLERAKSEEN